MSLKQSCFKAQIISDIKRLWWMSALATLFMFLFTTVPLMDYINNYSVDKFTELMVNRTGGETQWLLGRLDGNYIFAIIIGGALSLGLFSYLNGVSSVTFNHALPVKRNALLASHSVTAVIFIAIPIVVNSLICVSAVWEYCSVKGIFINMGIYFVYAFLIYAIFTFVAMLTGNTAAHGIFSVILILLPLFLTGFTVTLCNCYLYGFADGGLVEEILAKYVYLLPESLMGPKVLVYVLFIVVFYLLAMFTYNKRHLENYGEVIAFPRLKWLFKLSFGICTGILGYFYCQAFWNLESILIMIVFGTLGVIIANMLSNKSFSLKGSKMPIIYNAIFVLVLFVIFKFDITGFENRIPDVEDIVSVTNAKMKYDGYVYGYIDDEYGYDRGYREQAYNMVFTDKEDIEMFTDFHKKKVQSKDVGVGTRAGRISGVPYNVELEYTLKNGSKLRRVYVLDDSDVESFVKPFIESVQYKKFRYPILDGTEKEYTTIKVFSHDNSSKDNTIGIFASGSKELETIIAALAKDCESMTFEQYLAKHNSTKLYSIEVSYKVPAKSAYGTKIWIENTESYDVSFFSENTLNALEETGCITQETAASADRIEKIIVHPEGVYALEKYDDFIKFNQIKWYVETSEAYSNYDNSKTFTKREDIQALFEYFTHRELINPYEEKQYAFFSYEIYYKDGSVYHYTMYDSPENLPSLISFVGQYKQR